MKIISKKAWYIVLAITAVITAASFVFDDSIARLMFVKNNFFGSFCENIAAALPLIMCSFAASSLMICRNTRATRRKNRFLNVVYGILCAMFAFFGAYYPFRNEESINYIIPAGIALALTALFSYVNFTVFKTTYQKIVMSDISAVVIISTIIIAVICAGTAFLPERMNYATIQRMYSSFYSPDEKSVVITVPFALYSGAASTFAVMLNVLPSAVPKLNFSSKPVMIFSFLWTAAIAAGLVCSGNIYASQAAGGALIAYAVIFVVSAVVKKREKRI